ncbi:hypothetical protein [Nonomuraea sp. B1E8]|uniref:hypothetical protein n=1 Tax=unclassified Nonomuraea TaxID=2593643 RepID=UPI00325E7D95
MNQESGSPALPSHEAADAFLATPRTANPNTRRAYATAIDKAVASPASRLSALTRAR